MGLVPRPERWPSGRRRAPAKGVWVKSPSRVRIPLSPPSKNPSKSGILRKNGTSGKEAIVFYCQPTGSYVGILVRIRIDPESYLRNVHTRIADYPVNRVDELLRWKMAHVRAQAACLAA